MGVTVKPFPDDVLLRLLQAYSRLDLDLRDGIQVGDLSHVEAHAEQDRRDGGETPQRYSYEAQGLVGS